MMRAPAVPAAFALLSAACSATPQRADNAAPAADATPTAAPANAASPTVANWPVKPGAVKTFGDWSVACDNVARCTMGSLGPEEGDFPEYTIDVARTAGPAGGWEISLYTQRDASPIPAAMVIDGNKMAFAGDALSGPAAAAIVAAMANGRTLKVVDAADTTLATISLAGASAALRYIDAAQGRAGGVTAVVAKGPASASAVPAAPVAPTLTIVPIAATAGKASAAEAAQMRKMGECEDPPEGVDWSPELHPLGHGKTLAIVPCSAGAYNVIGALFVIDGARVTPAQVDAPAGFEETGADSQTPVHSVINGAVNAGQLSSWAKGRGLGDCGLAQTFAWDGRRLRLTEQREMPECRGNQSPLRTWTVRTTRP